MSSFLIMMSYFTRIPVGKHVEYSDELFRKGLRYYSLVGLVIGLVMVIPMFISKMMPFYIMSQPVAILVLLIYLWASGCIHIDGFSDSLDGLFSGREKDKMLEIMKDSRIGAFGAIGIIILLLTYYSMFLILPISVILVMPVVGKSAAIYGASVSSYARKDGMGSDFINYMKPSYNILTLFIMIAVAILTQDIKLLIALAFVYLITEWVVKSIEKKIDGMTGDTLGYVVELSQMLFLLIYSLIMHM